MEIDRRLVLQRDESQTFAGEFLMSAGKWVRARGLDLSNSIFWRRRGLVLKTALGLVLSAWLYPRLVSGDVQASDINSRPTADGFRVGLVIDGGEFLGLAEERSAPQDQGIKIKGEIPERDRIKLPSVTEVKYLPVESYTMGDGERYIVKPEEIMIHWDAQENSQNRSTYLTYTFLSWRTNHGDPVSTHFSVGPGGPSNGPAILQMLPMSRSFVQMGILSNGPSTAINIETTGMYYDTVLPPQPQTENLLQLTLELMSQYGIPFGSITGHLERSPDLGKIDPGQGYLNMVRVRLLERLIAQGRWDLIGSPDIWSFHKQAIDERTGMIVKVPTQTSESILASLSAAARYNLSRQMRGVY